LKLLVVGAGGQVGEKITRLAIAQGHEVYGTYKSRVPVVDGISKSYALDKTSKDQVSKVVEDANPDVLIDTGALHNVDYCESHPEEAMAVNRDGTAYLSAACNEIGGKFIFVSTDFVFDGQNAPYTEEDKPNPLSVYARSKLEGERAALSANKNTAVCRPAVIYSWVPLSNTGSSSSSGKPLNFGAWLVSQLFANKEVKIVRDQITSPTLADDLAGAILAIAKSSATGVFHTAGATPLSRYDFSVKVANSLGLNSSLIQPIDSSQLKQLAKRPLNSSLISNRIRDKVRYNMLSVDEALRIFAEQSRSSEVEIRAR